MLARPQQNNPATKFCRLRLATLRPAISEIQIPLHTGHPSRYLVLELFLIYITFNYFVFLVVFSNRPVHSHSLTIAVELPFN